MLRKHVTEDKIGIMSEEEPLSHAKMIIIDRKEVLASSANLAKHSYVIT